MSIKKRVFKILVLLLPFLFMVMINELTPINENEQSYQVGPVKAINSNYAIKDKCTWHCHNNTIYCKKYHTKHLNSYFNYIDPIYFGAINLLKSTGNYGAANLIVFVFFLPLSIWFLIFKNYELSNKIKNEVNKKYGNN